MSHCNHCGELIDEASTGKPRSIDQHRRFFALCRAVFHHWPERHAVQFGDKTECRKYLQMKSGHREIGARIPLVGVNRQKALLIVEAAIRGAGSYAVPVVHGDSLVVWKPKSIAFAKLGHEAFCTLNNEVEAVIRAETGLDPEQLLTEHANAA